MSTGMYISLTHHKEVLVILLFKEIVNTNIYIYIDIDRYIYCRIISFHSRQNFGSSLLRRDSKFDCSFVILRRIN